MRENLAPRLGRRGYFTATFRRYGEKKAYKGPPIQTLLFVEVKDEQGEGVTNHLWFKTCKAWARLALREGDTVRFCARVSTYWKGYRGRRDDEGGDSDGAPLTLDYQLSFPTDVSIVAQPIPSAPSIPTTEQPHQPDLFTIPPGQLDLFALPPALKFP